MCDEMKREPAGELSATGPGLGEIEAWFDDVLSGRTARDEADRWAMRWLRDDFAGVVELDADQLLASRRKPEAGSRKPEAGSRKPEAGSRARAARLGQSGRGVVRGARHRGK
ncbi:hypothetical protein [Amycolatopsis sp. CA-128772]|uniref:hypothetical protein n=1 Tax=Amycolatopsis sp. CA-128772 TaxID=2073159 RepID=UPI000CD2B2EE|nr:hypothetical protein [Amycolatopsis sp. CA-128772]